MDFKIKRENSYFDFTFKEISQGNMKKLFLIKKIMMINPVKETIARATKRQIPANK